MKNRSENLAGRGQILPVLQGNSRSIAQKSGEIWTGQANLQPISFKSDRLLVCMVSSRLEQAEMGFDEVLAPTDDDFAASGLKAPSVLRLSRLAVLDGAALSGSIGSIGNERLAQVRFRLAKWIAANGESDA